jgi:hypothetical protein
MLVVLGGTVGSMVGWWLGALVGFMTAFFMSVVGTAAGVYFARKWAMRNLA